MDNELEERIRFHAYAANPAVERYLDQRRSQTNIADFLEQTTVRERHSSGVSVASVHSIGDDQIDSHERCMTPVPNNQLPYDLCCIICKAPAINPFRCTSLEEQNIVVADNQSDSTQVFHLCCYQCLANYMLQYGTDRFQCPYCFVREFNFNSLVFANEQIIRDAENYVINCPNNCGLMGSPLALANHICSLQPTGLPGHTKRSNEVQNLIVANNNLNAESSQFREELSHVLHNHNQLCHVTRVWRSKFFAMSNLNYQTQVKSELTHNTNTNLRIRIDIMESMINRLQEQKKEAIKTCRLDLRRVSRHYKTRVQELTEVNERLSTELRDLIDISVSGDAATNHRRSRSDSSPTESSDEHSLPALFASPPLNTTADNGPQNRNSSSDDEIIVSN